MSQTNAIKLCLLYKFHVYILQIIFLDLLKLGKKQTIKVTDYFSERNWTYSNKLQKDTYHKNKIIKYSKVVTL